MNKTVREMARIIQEKMDLNPKHEIRAKRPAGPTRKNLK
jgi:hypothetical protein